MKIVLKSAKNNALKYIGCIQRSPKDGKNGGEGINKKLLSLLMRTQSIDEVTQRHWAFNYARFGPRQQVTKKQVFSFLVRELLIFKQSSIYLPPNCLKEAQRS